MEEFITNVTVENIYFSDHDVVRKIQSRPRTDG